MGGVMPGVRAGPVGPAKPAGAGQRARGSRALCDGVPSASPAPSRGTGRIPASPLGSRAVAKPYLLLARLPNLLHLLVAALHLLGVGLPQPLHLHLEPQLGLEKRGERRGVVRAKGTRGRPHAAALLTQ